MATLPQRLFDTRNGNDAVDKDKTIYPAATLIVFRDAAAKAKIIQSFCDAYSYQVNVPDPANPGQTIPNPQSKQAFYTQKITEFVKDIHRSVEIKTATDLAAKTAKDSADTDLPEFR